MEKKRRTRNTMLKHYFFITFCMKIYYTQFSQKYFATIKKDISPNSISVINILWIKKHCMHLCEKVLGENFFFILIFVCTYRKKLFSFLPNDERSWFSPKFIFENIIAYIILCSIRENTPRNLGMFIRT